MSIKKKIYLATVEKLQELLEDYTPSNSSGNFNIKISAMEYAEQTVTLTDGMHTYTVTLDAEGAATASVAYAGTYTVSIEGNEVGSVDVGTYKVELGTQQ